MPSKGQLPRIAGSSLRCKEDEVHCMSRHKSINKDNFLQPDALPGEVAIVQGHVRAMIVEDLLEYVREFKLTDRVPPDVAELFEVATGACVYGFLYRPLLTMGYHYALLAVEAALFATYEEHGGMDKKATMGITLAYLKKESLLPLLPSPVDGFPAAYDLVKRMRDNVFAHPRFATMLGVGGFSIFELCVDLINALYPQDSAGAKQPPSSTP